MLLALGNLSIKANLLQRIKSSFYSFSLIQQTLNNLIRILAYQLSVIFIFLLLIIVRAFFALSQRCNLTELCANPCRFRILL